MSLRQLYPDESGGGGASIKPAEPPTIDIVFVHGLDSNDETIDGRRTWTADDEQRTCWPRDMLPKHMPNARVLYYEYAGTVKTLYLAHNHAEYRFRTIIAVTIGVVFFSTPHIISDPDEGNKLCERILHAVGNPTVKDVVKKTLHMVEPPPEMLYEMMGNANNISDITRDFVAIIKKGTYNIEIHNFSEELKFPGLKSAVVSRDQASLEHAPAMPLHGNHITVCKFADDELGRSKFMSVKGVLEGLVRKSANASSVKWTPDLEQRLNALLPDARHCLSDTIKPTEGTGGWVTQRPDFKAWMAGNLGDRSQGLRTQKLCIFGKPASGKTHLAKQILTKIQTRIPVLECFLKPNWTNSSSCDAILKATLAQLARVRPELLDDLESEYPRTGYWPSETLRKLWPRFVAATLRQGKCIAIVIDGFDVISVNEQKAFLDCLERCEKESGLLDQHLRNLRILVLSRECDMLLKRGFTKYEIQDDDIVQDIQRTVKTELDEFASNLGYSENEQKLICDEVTKGARGYYLWATVVMAELRKMGPMRGKWLEKYLEQLPRHLAELFDSILSRICAQGDFDENMTRWILLWVVYCLEPLTVGELREAAALTSFRNYYNTRPDSVADLEDGPVMPAEGFRSQLFSICGPLLRVSGDHVEPVHRTLTQFLTTPTKKLEQRGSWKIPTHHKFHMPEGKSHAQLGRLCMDYLSMNEFRSAGEPFDESDRGARWEMKVQARINKYPLVRYSALSWLGHMKLAGEDWEGYDAARDLEDISKPCTESWYEVWWFCREWRDPYPFANGDFHGFGEKIAEAKDYKTTLAPEVGEDAPKTAPPGPGDGSDASAETLVETPSQPQPPTRPVDEEPRPQPQTGQGEKQVMPAQPDVPPGSFQDYTYPGAPSSASPWQYGQPHFETIKPTGPSEMPGSSNVQIGKKIKNNQPSAGAEYVYSFILHVTSPQAPSVPEPT
ncbi:hypothetical protein VTJ49DRAFT_4713 [Mycothermus thermophilus]|uniref:Nephrocystin 3-like N-terminal domain-containing protein n=1 Tax=Humicola insolens TaxID=85995 RepID=A0ABR3V4Q3_HUMIN